MSINIAIDIQPLATESAQRGMGRYTLDLLEEIFRQDSKNNYFLFNIYGDCVLDDRELPQNVHYTKLYPGADEYLLDYAILPQTGEIGMKYDRLMEGIFQKFIQKHEIDTFFVTSPFDLFMIYSKAWFAGTRVVSIFYDLVPWLFKEQYMPTKSIASRYDQVMDFLLEADALLAISQSAKDDIVRLKGMDADKVHVIHAGVSSGFEQKTFDAQTQLNTYGRYGIDSEYMLFPSGDDFRKNALNTVRSYVGLPKSTQKNYQLVVTGKSPEAEMEQIETLLSEQGIADRVIFTGYIPYEDLLLLYNHAKLVLFPSLYEGFGLPVIEAFKCGKDVVTSDVASLGEVAEGAAILVDPYNVSDITRGVRRALATDDFSAFEPIKQERIEKYTWENSARLALEAIQALPPVQEREKTRKLAVFAPLFPKTSDIAQKSEALLQKMEQSCEIDIYVAGDYPPDRYLRVIKHPLYAKRAKTYDATLYIMADDADCLYMLPYIREFGGTVYMHDASIHHAVLQAVQAEYMSWQVYERMLASEVSEVQRFVQRIQQSEAFAEAAAADIDLNRTILGCADKVVVENERMRTRLLKKNIGYTVHVAPENRDIEKMLTFIFGPARCYADDADLTYICQYELKRADTDRETELNKVAHTLAYVMQDE